MFASKLQQVANVNSEIRARAIKAVAGAANSDQAMDALLALEQDLLAEQPAAAFDIEASIGKLLKAL